MVVDGIAYTFGVFLNEFVKDFNEGPGKVAWVGSLLSGMYLTAGENLRQTIHHVHVNSFKMCSLIRSCGISARE